MDSYNSTVPTVGYLTGMNPINLGHVSSHWRNVAINTAKLWSTVCIDHPRPSHVNLAKIWLERAKTHPLQITIKCSRYLPVHSIDFLAVLRLFLEKINFWHSIDFEIPLEIVPPFSKVLKGLLGEARQLECAEILVHCSTKRRFKIKGHEHRDDILAIESMWKSIHASPTLKYVNWKSLYEDLDLPEHAPYKTLESLELDYSMDPCKVMGILLKSPVMKNFRAYGLPSTASPKPQISVLYPTFPVNHGLKALSMTVSGDIGTLFDHVTLPELRKLHITYQLHSDWGTGERQPATCESMKFSHFLLRSGCLLNDVWLKDPPYNDQELCAHLCSPAFQGVTRLRLTGTNVVTDRTILLLTLQQNDTGILPNINNLWLDIEDAEVTDGVVSSMVASRWSQRSWGRNTIQLPFYLTEVHLKRNFYHSFGKLDISELSLMKSHGLRVSISPGTLQT